MWTQVSTRAIFFCGEAVGEFSGSSALGVVKSRQEAAADLLLFHCLLLVIRRYLLLVKRRDGEELGA